MFMKFSLLKKIRKLKKYKTEITIFLLGFLFYFLLGLGLSYYLDTANFWNVLFDLDTPRVLGDLSLIDYNHYRTSVHPLFVICFQPFVIFLNKIINNPIIVIILIQCVLSSITLVSFFVILKKIGYDKLKSICLSIIFAVSFGQIIFSSSVETYIYAQFFLMLLWLFTAYKIDKKFNYWDYILITLLGIGSIAVTLTNFFQFLIVMFFTVFLNKKIKNRCVTGLLIIFCSGALSVFFAEVQNIIWPSAPNFFSKIITDFIYGTSEEKLYISSSLGITNVINVINASFSNSFNISNFGIPGEALYLTFQPSMFSNIFSIVSTMFFVTLNIIFMIKTKLNVKKHKLYYALLLACVFNLGLHLFYGNTISFIYVCHFNFIIILLIVYILKNLKIKLLEKKQIIISITALLVLLSLKNIIIMFKELSPLYNSISYFRILPIVIVFVVISLLILINVSKKHFKIIGIFITIIICSLFWFKINDKEEKCIKDCSDIEKYELSLKQYEYQLRDMKNNFSVANYSKVDEPIGIFYFGMVDRRKMVYKNGKLIDAKTQEIVKQFDYDSEFIIPNEYTVILKDDKNTYKIYEDEKGIFIDHNGQIELLSSGNKKINLPEFDSYKYSEILKVLHQEILFNIDGDVPKPNIFGYKEAWYRDTMLATMVLEQTNNVKLLEDWLKSVISIYDYSRSKDIKETDNLGELLYIIGAVGIDRNDLVNEILKEVNNLKRTDGSIGGIVDGFYQSYYPTVLVLNGARKLGIEVDLIRPSYDDGYAKLTWYYDKNIATTLTTSSKFYPYLNWGFYNFAGYGSLYVLGEIYPLSYEGGDVSTPGKVESECFISDYYCSKQLYISHLWHASEMFLYLKNY